MKKQSQKSPKKERKKLMMITPYKYWEDVAGYVKIVTILIMKVEKPVIDAKKLKLP